MHVPPPGLVRNPGPHLDQALDQPVHGPLYFFAPDIELPDHMQEVVGQNSHLQAGLISFKTLAVCLVPAEGILALLDPVFYFGPALLSLPGLTGRAWLRKKN